MAFGQSPGPPAPARRVAELAELLEQQGYASFREARHPFGLTQRQAGGKFTANEVDALIERLEADLDDGPPAAVPASPGPAEERRRARAEELVVGLDAEVMATELVNRGWCCIPPE